MFTIVSKLVDLKKLQAVMILRKPVQSLVGFLGVFSISMPLLKLSKFAKIMLLGFLIRQKNFRKDAMN